VRKEKKKRRKEYYQFFYRVYLLHDMMLKWLPKFGKKKLGIEVHDPLKMSMGR
jgi:hypothetical protein